jgi:hypothetical protein
MELHKDDVESSEHTALVAEGAVPVTQPTPAPQGFFGRVHSTLDGWGRTLTATTVAYTQSWDQTINSKAKPVTQSIEGLSGMVADDITVAKNSSFANYETPLFPALAGGESNGSAVHQGNVYDALPHPDVPSQPSNTLIVDESTTEHM